MTDSRLDRERERLIQRLKDRGYITSSRVEAAFRVVPREEFVLPSAVDEAYRDTPLPIGHGQTISAPHMCAIMCEGLDLAPGMKVLEVGAGSGYHAALCGELVKGIEPSESGTVYTVEIVEALIDFAKGNLERTGYSDIVKLIQGDGGIGLPEYAPFDRILVAAAAPDIPPPLVEQLKPGGIMLIPVGSRGFYQELLLVKKEQDGRISSRRWGGVAFVPLTGEYGH
ncbi:MAG: protein-L-isoaspartate(D-aspartate) O-methyltransferase [Candidatus Thorarchaeota archaeon]|nr:MAG: protein-L-isoaspartate(D-aspartate) O-methyltransferase [Candidatus Thorarchaeota archaeon]